MTIIDAIILGIVQGLTEFIPVSSSGHLVVAHEILGVSDVGLAFDVALHIGTLMALLLFFYKDIIELVRSLFRHSPMTRVAWLLALATIPAVIAGVLLEDTANSTFRSPRLVAVMLIIVACLMLYAERVAARRAKSTDLPHISRSQALFVGLAQAVALIPGVSRSGSTITTGIFAGLNRVAATRFSFLLAIPITTGAILKVLAESSTRADVSAQPSIFVAGIVAAFISGFLAIRFLLKFVAGHTLDVFAYYRIALGVIILLVFSLR